MNKAISLNWNPCKKDFLGVFVNAHPGSHQQLEKPEPGFVVAGLEGVDEKQQEESVEGQRTGLNWNL